MFGVIVRRSLSLQRGAFTDLVFFLVLILSCRGQELIGPSQPIVVLVGDDVTLPCYLNPSSDAFDLTLEWARPDLNPRYVLVRRYGEEAEYKKHPSFRGRTSVFPDELKHGNISLKLSKVKLSDGGTYNCFIPSFSQTVSAQLVVGCVSSPDVQVTQSSDGVMLECESKGWYPEPEMFWLDAEGNLLSALSETLRGPDGLYTVSSRLSVERRHGNKFTCRVTQRDINQSRENHTTVPDQFSISSTPHSHVVISAVIGCAALGLIPAVLFAVWKWRQNRLSKSTLSEKQTERDMKEKKEETKKKGGSAWMRQKEEKKNQGGEIQPEAERRSEMERREEREETEISQQEEKQVHRFREQPAESMEEVKEEGLGTERETLREGWQRKAREKETVNRRRIEEEAARRRGITLGIAVKEKVKAKGEKEETGTKKDAGLRTDVKKTQEEREEQLMDKD